MQSIDDWINGYFDQHIGRLENDLTNALSNQHKLFLPGNGVFLMQDVLFNIRSDLLATLYYNGQVELVAFPLSLGLVLVQRNMPYIVIDRLVPHHRLKRRPMPYYLSV